MDMSSPKCNDKFSRRNEMEVFKRIKYNPGKITEYTAKYYLELARSYRDIYSDETYMLAASGVLTAGHYLLGEKRYSLIPEIIDMAKEAVLHKNILAKPDPICDFIIQLQTKLLKIQNPSTEQSTIEEFCYEHRSDTEKGVQRIKKGYAGNKEIASVVSKFMVSADYHAFRRRLRIEIVPPSKMS